MRADSPESRGRTEWCAVKYKHARGCGWAARQNEM